VKLARRRFSDDLIKALGVLAFLAGSAALTLNAPAHAHWLLPAIAVALSTTGTVGLRRYLEYQRWQVAQATLTQFEEHSETPAGTRVNYVYPMVEYEYRFGDALHTGNTVAHDKQNLWRAEFNAWGDASDRTRWPWHEWEVGGKVTVFIDPRSPQRSVLIRDLSARRRSHHVALVGAGIAVALAWLAWLNFG